MRAYRFMILAGALASAGCTENNPDDGAAGKSIGNAGGFVTSSDGVFTVVFPPGSLAETTLVTVSPSSDAPISLGIPYGVQGPAGLSAPIFIEYRYTLAQVQGRDLDKLNLGGASSDRWEPLTRTSLNLDAQTVTATTPTLAIAYGLIEGGVTDPTGTDTEAPTDTEDPSDTDASSGSDDTDSGSGSDESSGSDDTDDTAAPGMCGDGRPEPGALCLQLAPPLIGTGLGPVAIATADVDVDGSDDVLVALAGSTSAALWLSQAQGFGAEQLFAVAAPPLDIAVADLDGDGALDIATIATASGGMLPGDGAGGFAPEVAFALAAGSAALAAGDLDEDGVADLVVAHTGPGQVGLLAGGAGGLFDEVAFTAGTGPVGIALGDFVVDRNVDVLTIDATGLAALSGNGGGLFGQPIVTPVAGAATDLAAADFNDDGTLDVAVVETDGDRVVVFFGNGLGAFGGAVPYAVGVAPAAIATADFDGDGAPDLAVVGNGDDSLTVLRGQGNGSFDDEPPLTVGSMPVALAVGDFNGDAQPDLAVAQAGDDSIGIVLSNP